jgi:hypothetical protein
MVEKQPKPKSGTKVKRCDCKHAYQDEKYGHGMRVHNLKKDGDKANCTVCGREN